MAKRIFLSALWLAGAFVVAACSGTAFQASQQPIDASVGGTSGSGGIAGSAGQGGSMSDASTDHSTSGGSSGAGGSGGVAGSGGSAGSSGFGGSGGSGGFAGTSGSGGTIPDASPGGSSGMAGSGGIGPGGSGGSGIGGSSGTQGDPCPGVPDGKYCGNDTPFQYGDPNTLYKCSNHKLASAHMCVGTCVIMPPGEADYCATQDSCSHYPTPCNAVPSSCCSNNCVNTFCCETPAGHISTSGSCNDPAECCSGLCVFGKCI